MGHVEDTNRILAAGEVESWRREKSRIPIESRLPTNKKNDWHSHLRARRALARAFAAALAVVLVTELARAAASALPGLLVAELAGASAAALFGLLVSCSSPGYQAKPPPWRRRRILVATLT